ncbi:MAG: NADH-quinone oxidoreductase subunit J [Chloroflexi bacterium]|nr:MAG: NADH-quinone oxidoreductase subunit J [Chloroflexota bacterium]
MDLPTVLFFLHALIAVGSAVAMLTSRNAVHAALWLVVNFVTIAVFFLTLAAPFIAMVQITVYAGAIMVLFLFVIMLLGAERLGGEDRFAFQRPLALLLAGALLIEIVYLLLSPSARALAAMPVLTQEGTPQAVGQLLFSRYLLPFELTSVLLLVAMIGVLVLTKD